MKPNYQYEKRQRDLAKKRKKEEKMKGKLQKDQTQPQGEADRVESPPEIPS